MATSGGRRPRKGNAVHRLFFVDIGKKIGYYSGVITPNIPQVQ